MNIKERVERILKEATGQDLSSWEEHTFLPSIAKYFRPLSPKQEAIVKKIEERLGLEENEDVKVVEENERLGYERKDDDVPF